MTPLPVLSCDDCGLCCDRQGTPPMLPEEYHSLPDALKWDVEAHGDRYDRGLPCLWYDTETKKCRHYEYRGVTCREFAVGSEDCLAFRSDKETP